MSLAGAGGGAARALTEILSERRQAELQALAQRQQEQAGARADADLNLRRQQEGRVAEAQRKQLEDAEYQRGFQRANTIAETAMPGDEADDETAALLKQYGLGNMLQPGEAPQAGGVVDPAQPAPKPRLKLRGGIRYIQGKENREAADQRARESNDLRQELATIAASGRAESTGLRNQLTQLQIDQQREKLEAAQTQRTQHANDVQGNAQNAIAIAQRLKTHPGLNKMYGAYEMRGFTQDARDAAALRDQLVAALTLPNLGSLKGPMSDKDVLFIKSLATRLQDSHISEGEAARAIDEAVAKLSGGASQGRDLQPQASHGGGGRVYYDASGRPVQW